MTAAAAANPQAPAPPPSTAPNGTSDAITGILRWLSETLPGGNLTLLGAVVIAVLLAKHKAKGGMSNETAQTADKSLWKTIKGLWATLVSIVKVPWTVLRFYGGYETRGPARSTATFLKAGTRTDRPAKPAPALSMATIAAAPPKVSLVKKGQPRPWARTTAAWIASYKGKGSRALDKALRAVLGAVRLARRVQGWAKAVARVVRAVYGAVAPVVTTLARAATSWHCWPYAARGAARLAATAAALGLLVPAWRTTTLVLLALGLVAAVAVATRFKPKPPSDDALYGDKVWTILRADLGLPEDEPRENWLHLPSRLADPGARIVIRLPWTFRGSELDRQNLGALINTRLPGEWVGRFSFTGEHATAVYTHKPPPKPPAPEPECPEGVDFFDPEIQAAIAACKKGEVVVGRDQYGQIIVKELGDSETPHWALSVGTGGGKSAFCQMVIAQLIRQGYFIIAADVKRVSVENYIGVPGVFVYNDPKNVADMRAAIEWFKDEIDARAAWVESERNAEFPGMLLVIEESNEFADISKDWWDDNRKTSKDEFGPADRAADPIWGTVASGARLGRFVHGNILAVFQDLRDQALGGKGLRNLFRLKFMGNYNLNQWKNVVGTTPVPDSVDKAGRMMVVEGNSQYWIQTCFAEPRDLRAWAIEQRKATGFDPAAGLFGTPPTPSPKRLPRLLERLSRDKLPKDLKGALEGGLENETAGRGVTLGGGGTGGVTAPRDRFRLIPGQGGEEALETPQADPTAPPELLPLSEIARRLEDDPAVPADGTMRKHKQRRDDFPRGIEKNGKELYTVSQIQAYYQPKENVAP
ncbi:hypothetical protein ACWGN5_40245 [Streptomyces sp. NPDC055815]